MSNDNENIDDKVDDVLPHFKSTLHAHRDSVKLKHMDLTSQQHHHHQHSNNLETQEGKSFNPNKSRHFNEKFGLHSKEDSSVVLPTNTNWPLSIPVYHKLPSNTPKWIIAICCELWQRFDVKTNNGKLSGKDLVDCLTNEVQHVRHIERETALGIGQLLLNEGAIKQQKCNNTEETLFEFIDQSNVFYVCICLKTSSAKFNQNLNTFHNENDDDENGDDVNDDDDDDVSDKFKSGHLDYLKKENKFDFLINRLIQMAPEYLIRKSLQKCPLQRTKEELALINEDLLLVSSLAQFSLSVRQELGKCLQYEFHADKHKAVFYQGDQGMSWYIIYRGSVWVHVEGQGYVCKLNEGDDFGKLALIFDGPRAASIILAEANCHFLKINKSDYKRILLNVEANMVRLKKDDSDVLILERVPDDVHKSHNNNDKNNNNNNNNNINNINNNTNNNITRNLLLQTSNDDNKSYLNYVITAGTLKQTIYYLLDNHLNGYEFKMKLLLQGDLLTTHLCAQIAPFDLSQMWINLFLTLELHTPNVNEVFEILQEYGPITKQFEVDTLTNNSIRYGRLVVLFFIWRFIVGLYNFSNLNNIDSILNEYCLFVHNYLTVTQSHNSNLSSTQIDLVHNLQLYSECLDKLILDNNKIVKIQNNCNVLPKNSKIKLKNKFPFSDSSRTNCELKTNQLSSSSSFANFQRCRNSLTRRTISGFHKVARPFMGHVQTLPHHLEESHQTNDLMSNFANIRIENTLSLMSQQVGLKFLNYHLSNKTGSSHLKPKSNEHSALMECLFGSCIYPHYLPLLANQHQINIWIFISDMHRSIKLTVPIEVQVGKLKQMIVDKYENLIEKYSIKDLRLVEVLSNGEWNLFGDHECGIMFGLSPNGRLFLIAEQGLKNLLPLAEQLAVSMDALKQLEYNKSNKLSHESVGSHFFYPHLNLIEKYQNKSQCDVMMKLFNEFNIEHFTSILTYSHLQIAICIQPRELLDYILANHNHPNPTPHIKALIRQFSILHLWTITQIVTLDNLTRRANLIRKFIKLANCLVSCPFYNLYGCLAIVLGLQNFAISRLHQTWNRVPNRWRRLFNDRLLPLIDPSKNHRAARVWARALGSQSHLPFLALILKDLRFGEDANDTMHVMNKTVPTNSKQTDLINFEKMRLMAQSLKSWIQAMNQFEFLHPCAKWFGMEFGCVDRWTSQVAFQKLTNVCQEYQIFVLKQFDCIDDPKVLYQLSLKLEPKKPNDIKVMHD